MGVSKLYRSPPKYIDPFLFACPFKCFCYIGNKDKELVNGHKRVTRLSIDSSAGRTSSADEEQAQCLISVLIHHVPVLFRTLV